MLHWLTKITNIKCKTNVTGCYNTIYLTSIKDGFGMPSTFICFRDSIVKLFWFTNIFTFFPLKEKYENLKCINVKN
jgi:hypothetical protein